MAKFTIPDKLENDVVFLVPIQVADFENLYKAASDPKIWEQHPQQDRYKREVFLDFFDSAIASQTAFTILDKTSGEIIGSSRYYDYEPDTSKIAIGYTFLIRRCWGGIYNKAVKTLMINYAFQFIDTVIFHIGIHNIRSQKGTEKTGAMQKRVITKEQNGRITESYEYELVKDIWKSKH